MMLVGVTVCTAAAVPSSAHAAASGLQPDPKGVTEFSAGMSPQSGPYGIVLGPDGRLWFPEMTGGRVAAITTTGVITEYASGISPNATPGFDITKGPDGNLWFAEFGNHGVGKVTPKGVVTEYSTGVGTAPAGLVTGADGALWFGEGTGDAVGRITTSGVVSSYPVAKGSGAGLVTRGADGNVWFAEFTGSAVGKITPAGVISTYPVAGNSLPAFMTLGADGNVWFTEENTGNVAKVTPAGVVTEFHIPGGPPAAETAATGSDPDGITLGPDGNVWFSVRGQDKLGRITPAGVITLFGAGITAGARPTGITTGRDGALWFTENSGNRIGRLGFVRASSATSSRVSTAPTRAQLPAPATPVPRAARALANSGGLGAPVLGVLLTTLALAARRRSRARVT